MDGTLINSSPAVVVAWKLFAETYPLDLEDILACKSARELGSRLHSIISMLTLAFRQPRSGPRNANHRRSP